MRIRFLHILSLYLLLAGSAAWCPLAAQTRIWSAAANMRHEMDKKIGSKGLYTTQYDGVHHLLGMFIDGSYSCYLTNIPPLYSLPGGYGLGAGLLYAYQHGPLLVQTGIGVRWQDVRDSVADRSWQRVDADSKTTTFQLGYSFTSRYDQSRNLYLQVPIMIGGYFWHMYALAGVRLSMQVLGDTYMRSVGTTIGDYSQFLGPFQQMDNHGFRKDVPISNKGNRLQLGFDVMATAELGYEIPFNNRGQTSYRKSRTEMDMRLRIALFAELGVLNIAHGGDAVAYTIPEATRYDFDTFYMTHLIATNEANNRSVHNIFVGVRISYFFFGYTSKEKCLLCGSRGYQSRF